MEVVGVEHGAVARDLDDDALHLGELLERVDALDAEVIGGDVEHRADVARAIAHAGAEEAAARSIGRKEDVGGDVEIVEDAELLMNKLDAESAGLAWRAYLNGLRRRS